MSSENNVLPTHKYVNVYEKKNFFRQNFGRREDWRHHANAKQPFKVAKKKPAIQAKTKWFLAKK